jgi:hypothetical protein
MSDNENWGEAVYPDGTTKPLKAPEFSIPEEQREYLDTGISGLTLWTSKREEPEQ